ncbi:MAG: response regulator, partial [Synergistaceae bacterium]|nr:response regulator [Synergistaceae bacterium]
NAFKYTHEGLVKMSVAAAGVDGDAGAGAGVTAAGEGGGAGAGAGVTAAGEGGGAGVTAAGEGGGGEAISAAGVMSGGGGVNSGGSASSSGASADTTTLIICVSDTGQGMTKENVEKLFDEYSRFGEGTNRSTEGTGLGMSITQKLLHLMNGKIHVESEIGKGSKFTVYIPQERIGSEVLGKEVANNLHNFRSNSRAQMRRVQITRESMPYGSVLIVDDVETNIYVAKGLLAPYELKIDSADSGIAAIEQIKRGREYDIVFMDHMMPKMDGIEATKIIRSMGYNRPIVALTANAVSGQADVFLGNGFDDFISKPIDIRQLNAVLNRLIRDRHPREAVYAAKQHVKSSKNHSFEDSAAVQQVIDPRFSEVFIRDASKALSALESISDKSNYDQEDNMRIYIINVHGIKSALASIGNKELSSQALELEIAAREGDLEKLKADTPAFLYSLRSFRDKLISQTAPAASGSNETVEDKTYLREKLLAIKGACEEYDDNVADETLAELKNAKWSKKTLDLLSTIAEQLLHSEFDDAVETINNYIELL